MTSKIWTFMSGTKVRDDSDEAGVKATIITPNETRTVRLLHSVRHFVTGFSWWNKDPVIRVDSNGDHL